MDSVIEKKGGLGRNLNALLGKTAYAQAPTQDNILEMLKNIPIRQLHSGKYQPRKHFDAESLKTLADSIQQEGILQPIVARAVGYERYDIIAGERRWQAAKIAGLTEVPVLLRVVSDEKALAIALIENLQREDLNPMEEAYALQRLIEEFSFTHQKAAEAIGKSRTYVTNTLRLLNLTALVKTWLAEGKLEMGHARALLVLSLEQQHHAAEDVITRNLSVRDTEQLVKQYLRHAKLGITSSPEKAHASEPNVMHFQQTLSEKLGAKVVIRHQSTTGQGNLMIYYNSLDELDGIVEHIN